MLARVCSHTPQRIYCLIIYTHTYTQTLFIKALSLIVTHVRERAWVRVAHALCVRGSWTAQLARRVLDRWITPQTRGPLRGPV